MTFNSVLHTQSLVSTASIELQMAREKVAACEERLARAIEQHRAQIARSLFSKDPCERQMAQGISEWWDMPRTSIATKSPRES